MGLIQSVLCSLTFCVERVLTWACFTFLLILIMFTLLVLMAYGIAVGYHYAQRELASFAADSLPTQKPPTLRRSGMDQQPVVRLVAVNRTSDGHGPQAVIDAYRSKKPKEQIFMEPSVTPIIILESERPSQRPELSANEREVAKKIIGRFRRSRNFRLFNIKNDTNLFRFSIPSI